MTGAPATQVRESTRNIGNNIYVSQFGKRVRFQNIVQLQSFATGNSLKIVTEIEIPFNQGEGK